MFIHLIISYNLSFLPLVILTLFFCSVLFSLKKWLSVLSPASTASVSVWMRPLLPTGTRFWPCSQGNLKRILQRLFLNLYASCFFFLKCFRFVYEIVVFIVGLRVKEKEFFNTIKSFLSLKPSL